VNSKPKTVVIHQPDFIPYLGFLHRLLHADLWIALDHVQFTRRGRDCWTQRDKIKTPQSIKWLSLAVKKCPLHTPIHSVLLSSSNDWRQRHLNQIRENYRRAPFFDEIFVHIEKLYRCPLEKMIDFNMRAIHLLLELFDIGIDITFSSLLKPRAKGNDMLVDLLQKVDAETYLSGSGAENYFVATPYEKARINVIWQQFKHPVYPQLYGDFIANLSSIDLLFNAGVDESRTILRKI
jgi:hypothetical protein